MTPNSASKPTRSAEEAGFFRRFRPFFVYAGVFSVFINIALLAPMLYMLQVFDRVLVSRSSETLVMLTLATVVALAAMTVIDYVRMRLLLAAGRQLDVALGKPMVRHLIDGASGVVRTSYTHGLRDVATLRAFLSGNNLIALFDAPWLIVFTTLIFLFHPWLGVVSLIGAVLLFLLAFINERANRVTLETMADATRRGSSFIDQGLRNADVLNGMGMTQNFVTRWDKINTEVLDAMRVTGARMGTVQAVTKFMRQATQVAMMATGAYLVVAQNLTPGIMVATTILFGRAMAPMESLMGNWSNLVQARAAYRRLSAIIPDLLKEQHQTELPPPKGHILVEDAVVQGKTSDHTIIRRASLELAAGQSLAILGPSGAGKSSLAKLIAGVWRPNHGHVRLDGADMKSWPRDVVGRYLGYLPQDVELFPGTIAENIARFGEPDDAEVVEAARRAHAADLILRLPQGFDTVIGERGIQLSAGQAQRLGLARALYGRPVVVVLDEPNANLDAEGEAGLLRTLDTLRQDGVTVVMITHKPSLVTGMDQLLVMRDGLCELFGPRDQVLAKLGVTPHAHGTARPAAAAVL